MQAALENVGWTARPPIRRGDAVADAAVGVDLLVVAVPDDAIAEVAAGVTPVDATVVVHLAGSLGLDALGAASSATRRSIRWWHCRTRRSGTRRLTGGPWFAVAGDPLARGVVERARGPLVRSGRRGPRRLPRGRGDRFEPCRRVARPGGAGGGLGRRALRGLSRSRPGHGRQRRRAGAGGGVDRAGRPRRRRDDRTVISMRCPKTSARPTRRSFAWPVGWSIDARGCDRGRARNDRVVPRRPRSRAWRRQAVASVWSRRWAISTTVICR